MKTIDLTVLKGAIFSEDRKFRYALWRVWNLTRPLRLQIGLNPSTANEISNDPTITRGIKRASIDGYGGFLMANLYAYVSTIPDILSGDGFIGAENDAYLKQMIELSDGKVLCAWGAFPIAVKRASEVLKMIPAPYCLGVNQNGQPKHPLYIGYDVPLVKYRKEINHAD